MNPISFGKAKLSDALRISVLMKTVYIQTYDLEGITIESTNYVEKRFSREYIESVIAQNPNQFIIAYHHQNPVGVAEIFFKTICPIRNVSVPELDKLYVLESFFGKGIGFGLMKEVEKTVLSKGYSELNIGVYIKNDRAINFYERQGYASIGQADYPMEHNTYKILIMNKRLIK